MYLLARFYEHVEHGELRNFTSTRGLTYVVLYTHDIRARGDARATRARSAVHARDENAAEIAAAGMPMVLARRRASRLQIVQQKR